MGLLSMFGLVTAEEHEKVKTRRDQAITDLANEVDARNRADLALATEKRANARLRENADLDRATIKKLEAEVNAQRAEIARLKPLAEATERRRANDAKRVRPSRAKKAPAAVKAAPKAKAPTKKAAR